MRLVASNGELSVDLNQSFLGIERADHATCIYAVQNGMRAPLGLYENRERALEVMDEIHNKYCNHELNNLMLKATSDVMMKDCEESTLFKYIDLSGESFIYRLPSE